MFYIRDVCTIHLKKDGDENDDMVIEVWRGLAETVSASCKIGDYVGINGRIHSRKYQKDEKVYLNYGFVAEKIDFLR